MVAKVSVKITAEQKIKIRQLYDQLSWLTSEEIENLAKILEVNLLSDIKTNNVLYLSEIIITQNLLSKCISFIRKFNGVVQIRMHPPANKLTHILREAFILRIKQNYLDDFFAGNFPDIYSTFEQYVRYNRTQPVYEQKLSTLVEKVPYEMLCYQSFYNLGDGWLQAIDLVCGMSSISLWSNGPYLDHHLK